jgi:hypothetical protein
MARFFDRPSARIDQPVDESTYGAGQRFVDAIVGDLSEIAVGFRNGKCNDRWAIGRLGPVTFERHVAVRLLIGSNCGRERGIDKFLDRGQRAKARGEVKQRSTDVKKTLFDLSIQSYIRSPEAIDGLLWIGAEFSTDSSSRS